MSQSHPAACENCAAPLQGLYCHACGQAAHSPVRSFAHAVEDVFESFWHLDGRIFRTLRRLLAPGALAGDYLAGRRAPYVAPMRLFVILCLLTFFVGKLVDFGGTAVAPSVEMEDTGVQRELSRATTVAEVEAIRDRAIADLEQAHQEMPATLAPVTRAGFEQGIGAVRRQADRRLVELGANPAAPANPPPADAVWISTDTPADGWLARQLQRIERNAPRFQQDPTLFKYAFMGSVPSALFVLVPVFALLLKLFYLGSGRLYLEHVVVALYSHAFLCVALLGQFALLALDHWITPRLALFGPVSDVLAMALWLWMPAYLLLMQKRVYGQGWLRTGVKFVVLGNLYATLLVAAAMALVVLSLVRA